MFIPIYPAFAKLNIMWLHTPESAVLSAVIFPASGSSISYWGYSISHSKDSTCSSNFYRHFG
ncbi:MAG TPA: hypothetical protein VN519_15410 [Bryobacteraceae bacterium]|nr:hypothetical protein [Bryobacteraceae bacterium]